MFYKFWLKEYLYTENNIYRNKNYFDFTRRAPQLCPHLSFRPWKSGKGLLGKFAPDLTHVRSLSTRSTASSRVYLFMSTKSEIYLDSNAILTVNYCNAAVHLETKQIYYLSSDFSHRREHKNWEPSSSTWAVEKEKILMKPSVMSRLVPGARYKNCLDDAGIGCAVWS